MSLSNGEKIRFMISGNTGLVGGALRRFLSPRHQVLALSRDCSGDQGCVPFDLRRMADFDFSRIGGGDVVAHAAAISSPDYCAEHPDRARSVNVDGTIAFIEGCRRRGARVLFFSTDLVLGSGRGLDEDSPYRPVGEYAAMKQEVENYFASDEGVKVLRLSYVVSVRDKYIRYLAACAGRGEVAEVFDPLCRSAVALRDVCRAVEEIAGRWGELDWRSVNLCGPQLLSRRDLAEIFKRTVDPGLEYTVVHPGEDFFLSRPEVVELTSNRLRDLLGRSPLRIEEALAAEHTSQRKD
ncbi:NAD-dependent epimerase/dehydratase family protein [Pseudodesulfovibrio karagichevae]|uniref:dTDP-4-dehydrorhamnose reductase n=1 Tax=Pseudodesulfovibrio karagichevae TaxID=3239305 RepID=A0ABV4K201_9BACT